MSDLGKKARPNGGHPVFIQPPPREIEYGGLFSIKRVKDTLDGRLELAAFKMRERRIVRWTVFVFVFLAGLAVLGWFVGGVI